MNWKMYSGSIKLNEIDQFKIPTDWDNFDDLELQSVNSDPKFDVMVPTFTLNSALS